MAYIDKFLTLNTSRNDATLNTAASDSNPVFPTAETAFNAATFDVANLAIPAFLSTNALPNVAVTLPASTATNYDLTKLAANAVAANIALDNATSTQTTWTPFKATGTPTKNVYIASSDATGTKGGNPATGKLTVTEVTAGTDPFNGNGAVKEVISYVGTQGEKVTVSNAYNAVTTANSDAFSNVRSEVLTGANVNGVLNTNYAHNHVANAGNVVLKDASNLAYNYSDANLKIVAVAKDAFARNTVSNGVEAIKQADTANYSYNLTIPAAVGAAPNTPAHKISLVYAVARNIAQTTAADGTVTTTVATSVPSYKFSDTTTGVSIDARGNVVSTTGKADVVAGQSVTINVVDTTGSYTGALYTSNISTTTSLNTFFDDIFVGQGFNEASFNENGVAQIAAANAIAVAAGQTTIVPLDITLTNPAGIRGAIFQGSNADDVIQVNVVKNTATPAVEISVGGRANGGDGNDKITGNKYNDRLNGENGNDTLDGGAGADNLLGFAGNDSLIGGDGADNISGGAGADTINLTESTVAGAAGIDTVVVGTNGSLVGSIDTITGFSITAGVKDILTFGANTLVPAADAAALVAGSAAGSNVQTTAGGLVIFAPADNTLALKIAAVQNDVQLDAINTVAMFVDGGNTYVYNSGAAIGNADDQLVQLTGLTTLTTITGGATTTFA